MVHIKLLKVSIGLQRYQVSFETMIGLIWVKIWALGAQTVFWADSIPPHSIDGPESPP